MTEKKNNNKNNCTRILLCFGMYRDGKRRIFRRVSPKNNVSRKREEKLYGPTYLNAVRYEKYCFQNRIACPDNITTARKNADLLFNGLPKYFPYTVLFLFFFYWLPPKFCLSSGIDLRIINNVAIVFHIVVVFTTPVHYLSFDQQHNTLILHSGKYLIFIFVHGVF